MAFHDLTTTTKPPPNLRSLLGLGLEFIPTPVFTNNPNKIKQTTLERYHCNLACKVYYAAERDEDNIINEQSDQDYDPKMHVQSKRFPQD